MSTQSTVPAGFSASVKTSPLPRAKKTCPSLTPGPALAHVELAARVHGARDHLPQVAVLADEFPLWLAGGAIETEQAAAMRHRLGGADVNLVAMDERSGNDHAVVAVRRELPADPFET